MTNGRFEMGAIAKDSDGRNCIYVYGYISQFGNDKIITCALNCRSFALVTRMVSIAR